MRGEYWMEAHENFRRLHKKIWNIPSFAKRRDRDFYAFFYKLLDRHFPE